MSLSSFLLGGLEAGSSASNGKRKSDSGGATRPLDEGLDDMFKGSKANALTQMTGGDGKNGVGSDRRPGKDVKKRKLETAPITTPDTPNKKRNRDGKDLAQGSVHARALASDSDEDDDALIATLEARHQARSTDNRIKRQSQHKIALSTHRGPSRTSLEVVESEEDSDDGDIPMHETMTGSSSSVSKGAGSHSTKVKYVPEDETLEMRDARTVFVGNVPIELARNRSSIKLLKRHILSYVPTAKIESVRLRSVAFQQPTAKPPNEDNPNLSPLTSESKTTAKSSTRQHAADRATSWKSKQSQKAEDDAGEGGSGAKKYLQPHEKKRVAFIKGEVNKNADSITAYIVFAHHRPSPTDGRESSQTEPMDPYAAAARAVELCDSTVFMEHTLRVDRARSAKSAIFQKHKSDAGDPKLSVFVGNLDFTSKEEDVRAFFEGVVSAERGPPSATDDDADGRRTAGWVSRVRIVRDRDTQLGKGFAYVQFVDRQCVAEVLALEQVRLKFAKRKLRVQRCKTETGAAASTTISERKPSAKSPQKHNGPSGGSSRSGPAMIPKGDPNLGAKLKDLSKEERKAAKATDQARLDRRLAKKKAKALMDRSRAGYDKNKGKDRDRTRKRAPAGKTAAGRPKRTGRVRSEKSLLKRNMKK